MTSNPLSHGICVGAFIPILKQTFNSLSTRLQWEDNYPIHFKRLGIRRDEMLILMPQLMGVDVLRGTLYNPSEISAGEHGYIEEQ
jgi:hypothetical protein